MALICKWQENNEGVQVKRNIRGQFHRYHHSLTKTFDCISIWLMEDLREKAVTIPRKIVEKQTCIRSFRLQEERIGWENEVIAGIEHKTLSTTLGTAVLPWVSHPLEGSSVNEATALFPQLQPVFLHLQKGIHDRVMAMGWD